MDYRRYPALMERYKELDTFSIDPQETRESLIRKLMDISYEKKQLSIEANDIIREYITKFEKYPNLLDEDAAAMLYDFMALLNSPKDSLDPLDSSISLRISRLLLQYYQSTQNLEKTIYMLRQCGIFDLILNEHHENYESTIYSLMAEQYIDDFDKLSDQGKLSLVYCLVIGIYDQKHPTYGLKKYREFSETFADICRKMGEDNLLFKFYYILFQTNILVFAVYACYKMEEAHVRGIPLSEPIIDMEKEAPLMAELKQSLEDVFASEQAQTLISDRVNVMLYLTQTDYYLGKITIDEFLSKLEEYSQSKDDYDIFEQSSAELTINACYLDQLCTCSNLDRKYVQNKIVQIINHVLEKSELIGKDLIKASRYINTNKINQTILLMLSTASVFLEFDFFMRTVLNTTVYANKELYVHTMIVKEISLVFLDYILDHNPQYLDGVAGYSWEYCRDHKQELMDLMENCTLLHDIGKYYCLDFVNNSSRNLTDDEFAIIKEHPTNFSNIYRGSMPPKIQCIRDCAELHHLWYDESGGYPRRAHTANKPFVNILTIADCIDAATDNIGRSYNFAKTLDQVMAEFDAARDTRYSGYISELLHVEEIYHKINHIINFHRQDIYCDIYL